MGATVGKLWAEMDSRPRRGLASLQKSDLPAAPGVYAIYRDEARIYVGKASVLRDRIWKNHCGRGRVMTGSAFRRNVAEHLGIASSADIKARRYQPTGDEVAAVRAFIDECAVAWIVCDSEPEAVSLESQLKRESLPPLTKL